MSTKGKNVKLFFLFLLFSIELSSAYNSNKCKRAGLNSKGSGWETHVVFGVINFSISSAQFISSTGACTMLGVNSPGREFYYANSNEVKNDFAKGGGEYAFAMARFYNCTSSGSKYFILKMKEQYSKFEGHKSGLNEEFQYIQKIIITDPFLKQDCRQGFYSS